MIGYLQHCRNEMHKMRQQSSKIHIKTDDFCDALTDVENLKDNLVNTLF